MKKMIGIELKRALCNKRYWLMPLAGLFLALIGVYRNPYGFKGGPVLHPLGWFLLILPFTELAIFAPLLAGFPYSDSFLGDWSHGFLRFVALRTKYQNYLTGKLVATAISGGLSIVIVEAIIFLVGLIKPFNLTGRSWFSLSVYSTDYPNGPFGELALGQPWLYFVFILLCGFLFGACMALMGLAASTLIRNRFVSLALPVVFAQLLNFLEPRINHLPEAFNPLLGLFPFSATLEGGISPLTLLLQYLIIASLSALIFWFGAKRLRYSL